MSSAALRLSCVVILAVVAVLIPSGGAVQQTHASGLHLNAIQMRLLSGSLELSLIESGAIHGHTHGTVISRRSVARRSLSPTDCTVSAQCDVYPDSTGWCSGTLGSNVRASVECQNASDSDLQGRGQAHNSPSVATPPSSLGNPEVSNVLVGGNDYQRGDAACGSYFSQDVAQAWAASTVPQQFIRGSSITSGSAREYWHLGTNPTVAFNTSGSAFVACGMLNRGSGVTPSADTSSAILVFRSSGQQNGAGWSMPGRVVVGQAETSGGSVPVFDVPHLAVDSTGASPFVDRLYVTWTTFAADGTAYIYESHSADSGETWAAPVLVSGDSALCTNTFGIPTPNGNCNENQYAYPFVVADGTVYVAYDNFNNSVAGLDNRYQILIAASSDGGATFSTPALVGGYYDLPDCVTYTGQDSGRSCVPVKGATQNSFFRAANWPVGVADPGNSAHIHVFFGSYINQNSNESNGCSPNGFAGSGNPAYTGVTTSGACENDIVVSESTTRIGGFTGASADVRSLPTVPHGTTLGNRFWPSVSIYNNHYLVAFFDRSYGDDDTTGNSDVTMAILTSPCCSSGTIERVTSSAMPPPTQFSGLFEGDFGTSITNTTVSSHTYAIPAWTDTRLPSVTDCAGSPNDLCTTGNQQDIFTQAIDVTASTVARVRGFHAKERGTHVRFIWRAPESRSLLGFNLFARHHRLNSRLIPRHTSPAYRYDVYWTKGGPYGLQAIHRR